MKPGTDGIYHVYPGEDIQAALDAAGRNRQHKLVQVHVGVYRPSGQPGELVWLNEAHEGITLEAVGEVVLTAANPDLARKSEAGYPAMVNHVVYFGDGISRKTVLRGFKITGANGYLTQADEPPIETSDVVQTATARCFFTPTAAA